jgi:hypothetical protein
MTQLFDRKPSGDSEWTAGARYIFQDFTEVLRNFLPAAEEDGPVDLRDLQIILKSAIDEVIHYELICRRVRSDTDPRDMGGPPEVAEPNEEESKRVYMNEAWQDW